MVSSCEQMTSMLNAKMSGNMGKRRMSFFIAYILILFVQALLIKFLLGIIGVTVTIPAVLATVALLYIGAFTVRGLLDVILGR
jgi:uncharacterized Tic20 family protein